MTQHKKFDLDNARAYPVSDAQRLRLVSARNEQGLPSNGRAWLKKLVHIRVGSLNIGSMTGRGREVADLMVRRKIGVVCVQETGWKGNKAKELREGCMLIYSGKNREGRNRVGIVLSKDVKDSLLGVNRRNDRVMSIKLCFEVNLNVVCAYAPQVGCGEDEKEEFWEQLEEELSLMLEGERMILGGDLNGYVGRSGDGMKECMEGGDSERKMRKRRE